MNLLEFVEMATQCSERQSKTLYLSCPSVGVLEEETSCDGNLWYVAGYFPNFAQAMAAQRLSIHMHV